MSLDGQELSNRDLFDLLANASDEWWIERIGYRFTADQKRRFADSLEALAAREEPQGVNQWLELQIQLTESQLAGLPEDLPGKPMSPLRASLAGVAYGLKLALEYSRNGLATVTFTTSVLALPCGRVIGTEAPMPDGAVRCPCGQVHPRQGRAEIATPWMVAPNA